MKINNYELFNFSDVGDGDFDNEGVKNFRKHKSYSTTYTLQVIKHAKEIFVHSASKKFRVDRRQLRDWVKMKKTFTCLMRPQLLERSKRLKGGDQPLKFKDLNIELAVQQDIWSLQVYFLYKVEMMNCGECTSAGPTLASNIPYAKSTFPRPLKQCISIGSEFSEDQFDQHCCFGRLNIMSWLQIVAVWNLVIDALCTFLSLEHIASYAFAVSTTISLICLCAVINGVQEEKKARIKFSALWVGLKLVVLCALSFTAVTGLTEEHLTHENFQLSMEIKLLFCLLPISAVLLFVQYHLSCRVIELIKLRDDLYVIPSAPGSKLGANKLGSGALSKMRNSLKLHLERQMKRNHVPTSPADVLNH